MNDLDLAKITFQTNEYTFVIVRDGRLVATGTRDGIGELLEVVTKKSDAVKGAVLADKIVGKAVAMVAAYAGISAVYTPLGSELARLALQARNIPFEADVIVPLIQNKPGTGLCPMEQLTLTIEDPSEAFRALSEFVAQRRTASAKLENA